VRIPRRFDDLEEHWRVVGWEDVINDRLTIVASRRTWPVSPRPVQVKARKLADIFDNLTDGG
jgi:hypothetical protein